MPKVSVPRPITKELYAASLQCGKQLYLDYHDSGDAEDLSTGRQRLVELGLRLTELAREAFPQSETADSDDIETAAEQTRTWLQERPHVAVFDAAFAVDGLEVRADIAIADGSGGVEVYEVKSGTKVKPRHIRDLAFQVHTISLSGFEVRKSWVLHINTQYRHDGGSRYPVLEIFKHIEVTDKVRGQLGKVSGNLTKLRALLDDEATRDLKTGTHCHIPFPCKYTPACREEESSQPLLDLPELSRDQEADLRDQGVHTFADLTVDLEGLNSIQQRAIRASRSGELVIEPFVGDELRDVEFPLYFVDTTSLLVVLPMLKSSRPWHYVPFQWHATILEEDGEVSSASFVSDGKADPRSEFVNHLAHLLADDGTVMLYGTSLEHRMRELMEDLPDCKPAIREVLNQARFDLRQLVKAGVYHPKFQASFELTSVHEALVSEVDLDGHEIRCGDDAQAACERLMNSRTRAATREKLTAQLAMYGQTRSEAVAGLYHALLEVTQDAAESD